MKELAGEQRHKLGVELAHQFVALFICRRQDVPVRSLRQVVVFLILQNVVQVAESLLFGDEVDVKLPGISDELQYLFFGQRTAPGTDQRVILIIEDVLDVEGPYVHLVFRRSPDLALDEFDRRHGAAAYVVMQTAIAQRGPVADFKTRDRVTAGLLRQDHLSQCLCAVEEPLVGLAHHRHLVPGNVHIVRLGILQLRHADIARLENSNRILTPFGEREHDRPRLRAPTFQIINLAGDAERLFYLFLQARDDSVALITPGIADQDLDPFVNSEGFFRFLCLLRLRQDLQLLRRNGSRRI